MKFDPRYAILAILVILAVFKITQKETYMCGGKREGYKAAAGPKTGRRMPALGIKKRGTVLNVGRVTKHTENLVIVTRVVKKDIAVLVVRNKPT